MSIVIEARGVGKRYVIRHQGRTTRSFREAVAAGLSQAGRRLAGRDESPRKEHFWALRDISFAVERGDRIGIIGRNGAGKSTLLKILSRITEPTTGQIRIKGRVSSLLEVGTGFHPELSGRENIYLNGAILGMTRREIAGRFDEIVAFAEVERFIDTPVKHYSSGMYVRLAFAVAAHLEPEIMIVDEVLAVGDSEFQRKCLGRMENVSRQEGRTILFVSHQMSAVQSLCNTAMLVSQGRIECTGPTDEVIGRYVASSDARAGDAIVDLREAPRSAGRVRAITEAWIEDESGKPVRAVLMGSRTRMLFRFETGRLRNPGYGFSIENMFGQKVFSLNNYIACAEPLAAADSGVAVLDIPELPLIPGTYFLSLAVVEDQRTWVDHAERALSFDVVPADVFGTGRTLERTQGNVYVRGTISSRPDEEGKART